MTSWDDVTAEQNMAAHGRIASYRAGSLTQMGILLGPWSISHCGSNRSRASVQEDDSLFTSPSRSVVERHLPLLPASSSGSKCFETFSAPTAGACLCLPYVTCGFSNKQQMPKILLSLASLQTDGQQLRFAGSRTISEQRAVYTV